jgi:hypothetical protein
MRRAFWIGCLLILARAPPTLAQTHLTVAEGAGASRSAVGDAGTFDVRGLGAEFHLNRQWWIGVEVGLISGTGRGFAASDRALVVPVNLYGYLPGWARLTPFGTLGYASINLVGVGFDAGAGLDLRLGKHVALRTDVRGLIFHDKSGVDRFGMWRIGAVITLGR